MVIDGEDAVVSFNRTEAELSELAHYARQVALSKGASDVVVQAREAEQLSVAVRHAQPEVVRRSLTTQLSVTIFNGNRRGNAISSCLTGDALDSVIESAWHLAKFTAKDPDARPAEAQWLAFEACDLDLFHPQKISIRSAAELAAEIEAAASTLRAPAVSVDRARFGSSYRQSVLSTSEGFTGYSSQSLFSLDCSVVASNVSGKQAGAWSAYGRRLADLPSAGSIGSRAAERALERLDPTILSTRACPVLFDATVAYTLVGHLVGALNGRAQFQQRTFLPGALDKTVLAGHLGLEETAHEWRGFASASFDSDGVRTHDRSMVEGGVAQSYFLSMYSARKLGMAPTGHAGGHHNLSLVSEHTVATDDLAKMLRYLNRGLYVTGLIGDGLNAVTGDYSKGCYGFWVEHGQIQYPVEGITIAGNLKDMFLAIQAVGSDVHNHFGIRCGSVLIETMQIAGQ